MKALVLFFMLLPVAAFAANDERSKVECIDELQKFEFVEAPNEVVPDSFWQLVSFQHNGGFYEWDGKKIVQKIFETDAQFQSKNRDEKIWSRDRLKYNETGKNPKTRVATEDMLKVMDSLISQTLSNFHKRFRLNKKYTQMSVARIVDLCGNVDGAKVRVRNTWISAREYKALFHRFRPEYFAPSRALTPVAPTRAAR